MGKKTGSSSGELTDSDGAVWYARCVCGDEHSSQDRKCRKCAKSALIACDRCSHWLHLECLHLDDDDLPENFEFVYYGHTDDDEAEAKVDADDAAAKAKDSAVATSDSEPKPAKNTIRSAFGVRAAPPTKKSKASRGKKKSTASKSKSKSRPKSRSKASTARSRSKASKSASKASAAKRGKGGKKAKRSRAGSRRETKVYIHRKRKRRTTKPAPAPAPALAPPPPQVNHMNPMYMANPYSMYGYVSSPYYGFAAAAGGYYGYPHMQQYMAAQNQAAAAAAAPPPPHPAQHQDDGYYSNEYYEYEVEYEYSNAYPSYSADDASADDAAAMEAWKPGTLAIDCRSFGELPMIKLRHEVFRLDSLPIELLMYLFSFVPAMSKMALYAVSRGVAYAARQPEAWPVAELSFAATTLALRPLTGLAPSLVHTKVLDLSGCALFDDTAAGMLGHVLDGFSLRRLRLVACDGFTGMGLYALATHLEGLVELDLSGCAGLLDVDKANAASPVAAPVTHPALMSYAHKAFVLLVAANPKLRILRLDGAQVPPSALRYIAATSKSGTILAGLRELSVVGVPAVGPRLASALRSRFPPPAVVHVDAGGKRKLARPHHTGILYSKLAPQTAELYAAARQALADRDLATAERLVLEATQAAPHSGTLRTLLGRILVAAGEPRRADATRTLKAALAATSFVPGTAHDAPAAYYRHAAQFSPSEVDTPASFARLRRALSHAAHFGVGIEDVLDSMRAVNDAVRARAATATPPPPDVSDERVAMLIKHFAT
ncbi:uncharacterized protein AMSG_02386 [Thecamonas trahens ATCC 50062]|uniref:F-box domain-containing protein n=1 Tax=Thecamonas trahens ATCC 50062 TaxID=461836 RepID=A0A0L0DW22_THETB|nr:hypothetical protein AMSG_02386 [Thecamonas trahens ATCC 50062]KNC56415.1 hypothetical protein AMSG_02386 [Thecamonas trahens ATCC 50062]|eukprot:XP_013760928.1 hypothetical protein AMSG_02386 [Thecamonas trahens ATCC 50062]